MTTRIRSAPVVLPPITTWSVKGSKVLPGGGRLGFENSAIRARTAEEAEATYNVDGYQAEIVISMATHPYVIVKEIPRK